MKAYDAATGEPLWDFDPEVPGAAGAKACCDVVNRGLAAWGDKLYLGTLDGRLIALDRETGKEAWTTNTFERDGPYTITGAPRAADGTARRRNAYVAEPLRRLCRDRLLGRLQTEARALEGVSRS